MNRRQEPLLVVGRTGFSVWVEPERVGVQRLAEGSSGLGTRPRARERGSESR